METASNTTGIRIVDFEPRYRTAFKELNEAWIKRFFQIEDSDRKVLEAPEAHILEPGGHIVVALRDEEPVGVCALIKIDPQTYELAKMTVSPAVQGKGVGFRLGEAAVAWARARGATRIYLESNSGLKPAISLYRKLGFQEIAGPPSPYKRCDIQMELLLKP